MRRFNIQILALLTLCHASVGYTADLMDVYRQAIANDPTLQAARAALEATRQKLPQARAGLLPKVELNATASRATIDSTYTYSAASKIPPFNANRDINTHSWNLQLTQPLFRMQNYYAFGISRSQIAQAEAQYAAAEQDLILRTAQAYFDVLTTDTNIAAAEAEMRAMQEQLARAEKSFKSGAASITDVHEARSKADLARAQRLAAQNEREARRAELEKLIGDVPAQLSALQPQASIPPPQPADPQPWVEQARTQNPIVQAQRATLEAAHTEIDRNRAEYYPTLDLTASTGYSNNSGSSSTPQDYGTASDTRQIGLQLTIPLYAGGGTTARISEALANKNKAQAQLEESARKATADAKQAYMAVNNGIAQIEALESAIASGQSSVKGNQIGYQLGIRINSDVLSAEQQLYIAQRDLAKARHETLLQGLKLKAAAGILSQKDIESLNQLLKVSGIDP